MHLGYIIIYVEDVSLTVEFYEKAFGLTCQFMHDSKSYAEMQTGKTALAFVDEEMIDIPFQKNRIEKSPSGAEIALVSSDVKKAFDIALEAGATSVISPTMKPWGQTVAYVKDNNGFLVEICSPMQK